MNNNTAAQLCVAGQQWSGTGAGNGAVYQPFAANAQGDVMLTAQGSQTSDTVLGVRLSLYTTGGTGNLVTATAWMSTYL
jgi:hypothetical protein